MSVWIHYLHDRPQLDAQELELDDCLERLSKEFRIIFEAQIERAEATNKSSKSETLSSTSKKSNLKRSKSEDQTTAEKLKGDFASKAVRLILLQYLSTIDTYTWIECVISWCFG